MRYRYDWAVKDAVTERWLTHSAVGEYRWTDCLSDAACWRSLDAARIVVGRLQLQHLVVFVSYNVEMRCCSRNWN